MQITPINTHKITPQDSSLARLLDQYVTAIPERSILAVTSKIVSLCEGRVVKNDGVDENDLVARESDRFLPPGKYGFSLTLNNNILIPNAGIDQSNSDGGFILWPEDAQQSANKAREHLTTRFDLREFGVIITDSKTSPLRWGTTGIATAHSGFSALNSYVGKPDIFGAPMRVTRANIMDGLAASAVLVMGEGSEQTPMALIQDLPSIQFQSRNPTQDELDELQIAMEDDLYAPLLTSVDWLTARR
ncbi:MAG: hypothetical protein AUJ92_15430 [Armatimonadetes bacterium CG2_30_59_28]|nr:putative folate metabolism gamma-glutamate ligase [Armatimonadota bacterium]OIO91909.1 MAG: hypothetical protein AUJ92_15430 [Armatimonadetes bacterium CG2_30_59_28]